MKRLHTTIEKLHAYLRGSGAMFAQDRLSDVRRQIDRYNRRMRNEVMRDCGLVRGKDSMGRTIWE